jgi:hypothetical protein
MKSRPRFILAVIFLALASLACSLFSGQKPSNSTEARFEDDFSKTDSGWDRVNNEDGITDYDNGGYRIKVLTADTELWANPGMNYSDVRIEVDAIRQSGPEDNDYGVICRYQDSDNFYYLLVTSDGYYGIMKVKDGEMTLLSGEEFGTTDQINSGNATNHLRADCIGETLTLYVNGQKLDSQTDSDFPFGDVGLIAGTYTEPGTDIYFDNFKVFVP